MAYIIISTVIHKIFYDIIWCLIYGSIAELINTILQKILTRIQRVLNWSKISGLQLDRSKVLSQNRKIIILFFPHYGAKFS